MKNLTWKSLGRTKVSRQEIILRPEIFVGKENSFSEKFTPSRIFIRKSLFAEEVCRDEKVLCWGSSKSEKFISVRSFVGRESFSNKK